LVKKLAKVSNKEIKYLPNAADIAIFRNSEHFTEVPTELRGITKKIIGYTGNICHRINYDLLYEIAVAHQDKILLLVGPINNEQFYQKGLDKLPNVITT